MQHIPELMAKGRDKKLIELRDEALCRRYYYWTEVQRLRFDDALKVLSRQEFFISDSRPAFPVHGGMNLPLTAWPTRHAA